MRLEGELRFVSNKDYAPLWASIVNYRIGPDQVLQGWQNYPVTQYFCLCMDSHDLSVCQITSYPLMNSPLRLSKYMVPSDLRHAPCNLNANVRRLLDLRNTTAGLRFHFPQPNPATPFGCCFHPKRAVHDTAHAHTNACRFQLVASSVTHQSFWPTYDYNSLPPGCCRFLSLTHDCNLHLPLHNAITRTQPPEQHLPPNVIKTRLDSTWPAGLLPPRAATRLVAWRHRSRCGATCYVYLRRSVASCSAMTPAISTASLP
jgi:hypothetical protein